MQLDAPQVCITGYTESLARFAENWLAEVPGSPRLVELRMEGRSRSHSWREAYEAASAARPRKATTTDGFALEAARVRQWYGQV